MWDDHKAPRGNTHGQWLYRNVVVHMIGRQATLPLKGRKKYKRRQREATRIGRRRTRWSKSVIGLVPGLAGFNIRYFLRAPCRAAPATFHHWLYRIRAPRLYREPRAFWNTDADRVIPRFRRTIMLTTRRPFLLSRAAPDDAPMANFPRGGEERRSSTKHGVEAMEPRGLASPHGRLASTRGSRGPVEEDSTRTPRPRGCKSPGSDDQ